MIEAFLDISNNYFDGPPFDGSIFTPMQELTYLDISSNWLSSTFPLAIAELPRLSALYATSVRLSGDLSFLSDFRPNLFELWLDNNTFTGTIPSEIGRLTGLASLSFSDCGLDGTIPSEIGLLTNMQQMWLFGNRLVAPLPTELGSLSQLRIFQVEGNAINGTMPLQVCSLRNNQTGLVSLGADCHTTVQCTCCTCCTDPCPFVSLPSRKVL